jgi:hypothetical protein
MICNIVLMIFVRSLSAEWLNFSLSKYLKIIKQRLITRQIKLWWNKESCKSPEWIQIFYICTRVVFNVLVCCTLLKITNEVSTQQITRKKYMHSTFLLFLLSYFICHTIINLQQVTCFYHAKPEIKLSPRNIEI